MVWGLDKANAATAPNGGFISFIKDTNNANTNVKVDATALATTLSNTVQVAVAPILGVGKSFRALAYCGYAGVAYQGIKTAICANIVNGLAMLALAFLLIGLTNLIVIICSTILAKRIGAPLTEGNADFKIELGLPGAGLPGQGPMPGTTGMPGQGAAPAPVPGMVGGLPMQANPMFAQPMRPAGIPMVGMSNAPVVINRR